MVFFTTLFFVVMYGQVAGPQQFVHILTREEAQMGIQLGCSCYQGVDWLTTNTAMTAVERKKSQPIVKSTKTESYDLYQTSSFGFDRTLKERHTVVVIDLRMWEKNNNTECMDKRELTFMAEIQNMPNLNLGLYGSNIIKNWALNYTSPSGNNSIKYMESTSRIQKNLVMKKNQANSNLIDSYILNYSITFKGKSCTGEVEKTISSTPTPFAVNVYKLWITKFRDDVSKKDWKAVVGSPIEYAANASPDCTAWNWSMIGSVVDTWHLTLSSGSVIGKSGNNMKIPFSDLSNTDGSIRVKNADFGDKNGNVRVSCIDRVGTTYLIYSNNVLNGMSPSIAAKVFYSPEKNIEGNPVSMNFKPPCWYLFWKEGAVEGLENFNYTYYSSPNTIEYGHREVATGRYVITQYAGPNSSSAPYNIGYWDLNNQSVTGNTVGTGAPQLLSGSRLRIDCCAHIVTHELNHGSNAGEKSRGASDIDAVNEAITCLGTPYTISRLGDGLPDNWEVRYGCSISKHDTHNVAGTRGLCGPSGYSDYGDDEVSCEIEAYSNYLFKINSSKDWSKDGKQW